MNCRKLRHWWRWYLMRLSRYTFVQNVIKLCNRKLIAELPSVTCHMGSHSDDCHVTQVNAPDRRLVLNLHCIYPEGMDSWGDVTLVSVIYQDGFFCLQTVNHPNRPGNHSTWQWPSWKLNSWPLDSKSNTLQLHQNTTDPSVGCVWCSITKWILFLVGAACAQWKIGRKFW